MDDTLADVTLNSNAIVIISGNVSGNWTNNNTYIVNGNIIVPSGQTLSIEQGTEIKFNGYYSLIVNGTLTANGTENSHIVFTSNNNPASRGDWNKIVFNGTSQISTLNFCTIEYGKEDSLWNGMIVILGKANITNSIVRETDGTGIGVQSTNEILIQNNEIYNSTWGITVDDPGTFNITSNFIHNASEGGILVRSNTVNTTISKNIVGDCLYRGIGIFGMSTVNENIIYNTKFGVYVGKSEPSILNNTIFSTENGIVLNDDSSYNPKPIIKSNIIAFNTRYAIYSEGVPKPSIVTYNLFYDNDFGIGNNNLPVGTGVIVTVNNNGTDSDTYFNIFSSPNLKSILPEDPNFCELNSNSDAIDAGDPSTVNNYNSTIIDIGARESSANISTSDFQNNYFTIYPNPINNTVKIQAKGSQSFNKIVLFNIKGQTIKEYTLKNFVNEYSIDNLNFLKSGIYIMGIYSDTKNTQQIKLLKI
jgi:hypothetical protein